MVPAKNAWYIAAIATLFGLSNRLANVTRIRPAPRSTAWDAAAKDAGGHGAEKA